MLSDADVARIEKMLTPPEPAPVLTGPAAEPFLRIDPAFMYAIDPEVEAALNEIKLCDGGLITRLRFC